MTDNILTQALLKEHLHYNPDTGVFTWIKKTSSKSNNIKIGQVAGTICNDGYVNLTLLHKVYKAHRLVWLYMYGKLPKRQLDHVNGFRFDNRLLNLREANAFENMQNLTVKKSNTSGFVGVNFNKKLNKWSAAIRVNKARIYLGVYLTPEEAHRAYVSAKAKHHTFNPVLRES